MIILIFCKQREYNKTIYSNVGFFKKNLIKSFFFFFGGGNSRVGRERERERESLNFEP